jgi:hypothetical protein
MMNKSKKRPVFIIGVSLILLAIVVFGYGVYLVSTYIDETITTGAAYGFSIGDDKTGAFDKAKTTYLDSEVYILHPLDKNGYGPHKRMTFTADDFKLVGDRDQWKLFFDKGFFNSIELTFDQGKLVKVYRHRKYFELP